MCSDFVPEQFRVRVPEIFPKFFQNFCRKVCVLVPKIFRENFRKISRQTVAYSSSFYPVIFSLGVRVARGRSFTGNACAAFRVVLLSGYCCRIVKPKDVLVIFTTVIGKGSGIHYLPRAVKPIDHLVAGVFVCRYVPVLVLGFTGKFFATERRLFIDRTS